MSDTYTQIHIQVIFAVKGRQSLIPFSFEDELYKYITGIVQNKNQKMLAINGMPDHIHFFIGLRPDCTLSDLVREVKKASNKFVQYFNCTSISTIFQLLRHLPALRCHSCVRVQMKKNENQSCMRTLHIQYRIIYFKKFK